MDSERRGCVHGPEVLAGERRIGSEHISIMEGQEVTENGHAIARF